MKPRAVYQVPWLPRDETLVGVTIVGRAHIDYPNGGRTHGLVIVRTDGTREVVYFDRTSLVFSTMPLL